MALRDTLTKGNDWALEALLATTRDEARWKRSRDWMSRALTAERVTRQPVLLSASVLTAALAITVAGWWIHVDVAPAFGPKPDDLRDAFGTLWQAHTAIVGLSIPLMVLLVEQAKSNDVLPTSAGQAMIARSWVVITTTLALGSVVVVGVAATYLVSYVALVTNMALSVICVLLILHGYTQALALLLSPNDLRRASEALLMKRLEESIRGSFEVAAANELIGHELGAWYPATLPRVGFSADDTQWKSVAVAEHDGVVADVNVRVIKQVLSVSAVTAKQPRQQQSDTDRVSFESTDPRVLFAPIGMRVRKGDPILALRDGASDNDLDALVKAFRVTDE